MKSPLTLNTAGFHCGVHQPCTQLSHQLFNTDKAST